MVRGEREEPLQNGVDDLVLQLFHLQTDRTNPENLARSGCFCLRHAHAKVGRHFYIVACACPRSLGEQTEALLLCGHLRQSRLVHSTNDHIHQRLVNVKVTRDSMLKQRPLWHSPSRQETCLVPLEGRELLGKLFSEFWWKIEGHEWHALLDSTNIGILYGILKRFADIRG